MFSREACGGDDGGGGGAGGGDGDGDGSARRPTERRSMGGAFSAALDLLRPRSPSGGRPGKSTRAGGSQRRPLYKSLAYSDRPRSTVLFKRLRAEHDGYSADPTTLPRGIVALTPVDDSMIVWTASVRYAAPRPSNRPIEWFGELATHVTVTS